MQLPNSKTVYNAVTANSDRVNGIESGRRYFDVPDCFKPRKLPMICLCGGKVSAIGFLTNKTQDVCFQCDSCRRQLSFDPPVTREEWLKES